MTQLHQWNNPHGHHQHRYTPHNESLNPMNNEATTTNSGINNSQVQQQQNAGNIGDNQNYYLSQGLHTKHSIPNNNGDGIPNTWNQNKPSWAPNHWQFNPPRGPGQPGRGWHDPSLYGQQAQLSGSRTTNSALAITAVALGTGYLLMGGTGSAKKRDMPYFDLEYGAVAGAVLSGALLAAYQNGWTANTMIQRFIPRGGN